LPEKVSQTYNISPKCHITKNNGTLSSPLNTHSCFATEGTTLLNCTL